MCTGRVDLAFLLRALHAGADGVIVGGCWPGECHYVTEGNYDALGNLYLCRKLLDRLGLSPDRVRIEWIASSEGNRFAQVMSRFSERVRELGPLGAEAGLSGDAARERIAAARGLVPHLKLVERFKLRPPVRTEEAVRAYYESEAADRLFDQVMGDKLRMSRLTTLLRQGPRPAPELAEALGLSPAELARLLGRSADLGLVRYDLTQNRYTLAAPR
jgi:coenzyme F420-reducing hydrogenase delta subunit